MTAREDEQIPAQVQARTDAVFLRKPFGRRAWRRRLDAARGPPYAGRTEGRMSGRERRGQIAAPEHVFPPDVVRTLREHVTAKGGCLADARTICWPICCRRSSGPGSRPTKARHNPIGASSSSARASRTSCFRKAPTPAPRPVSVEGPAVCHAAPVRGRRAGQAGGRRRRPPHLAVNMRRDQSLVIAGLIHEGFNVDRIRS